MKASELELSQRERANPTHARVNAMVYVCIIMSPSLWCVMFCDVEARSARSKRGWTETNKHSEFVQKRGRLLPLGDVVVMLS